MTKIETDFEKLNHYQDIETYYPPLDDIKDFLYELFADRVESQKYIVRTNQKLEQIQSNWNSLREENKALRLLLNWAEECDWGFDNFRDDDVVDWEQFEKESEDMGYIESMIYYAKKYLEMNELESEDK